MSIKLDEDVVTTDSTTDYSWVPRGAQGPPATVYWFNRTEVFICSVVVFLVICILLLQQCLRRWHRWYAVAARKRDEDSTAEPAGVEAADDEDQVSRRMQEILRRGRQEEVHTPPLFDVDE